MQLPIRVILFLLLLSSPITHANERGPLCKKILDKSKVILAKTKLSLRLDLWKSPSAPSENENSVLLPTYSDWMSEQNRIIDHILLKSQKGRVQASLRQGIYPSHLMQSSLLLLEHFLSQNNPWDRRYVSIWNEYKAMLKSFKNRSRLSFDTYEFFVLSSLSVHPVFCLSYLKGIDHQRYLKLKVKLSEGTTRAWLIAEEKFTSMTEYLPAMVADRLSFRLLPLLEATPQREIINMSENLLNPLLVVPRGMVHGINLNESSGSQRAIDQFYHDLADAQAFLDPPSWVQSKSSNDSDNLSADQRLIYDLEQRRQWHKHLNSLLTKDYEIHEDLQTLGRERFQNIVLLIRWYLYHEWNVYFEKGCSISKHELENKLSMLIKKLASESASLSSSTPYNVEEFLLVIIKLNIFTILDI